MSFSPARPDVLALLHEQQRNYNAQLGESHEGLSKLYKKLAKVECVLAEQQVRGTKRSDSRKWKYTQILTKKSIATLQARQDTLHQHLAQCISLIGSYSEQTLISPASPWMTLPPSPFMLTPSTAFPFSPWAANFSGGSSSEESETTFWDLSRLREPSPFSSMADSGYHEPGPMDNANEGPSFSELDQIFSHATLLSSEDNARPVHYVPSPKSSDVSTASEKDEVPEIQFSSSPTKSGAQKHRRCVSADNPQLVDGGLDVPSSSSKRGTSVGPIAGQSRNGDNGLVV
jgi:hypothetical protein